MDELRLMETAKEFIDWFIANPKVEISDAVKKCKELSPQEQYRLKKAMEKVVNVRSN